MLLTLGALLLVVWALCLVLFKVASGAVHALLVLGVVAIVAHFVRRRNPLPASAG